VPQSIGASSESPLPRPSNQTHPISRAEPCSARQRLRITSCHRSDYHATDLNPAVLNCRDISYRVSARCIYPQASPASPPRRLVICSCGWERECSSEWAAKAARKLHQQLGDVGMEHEAADVPRGRTRVLQTVGPSVTRTRTCRGPPSARAPRRTPRPRSSERERRTCPGRASSRRARTGSQTPVRPWSRAFRRRRTQRQRPDHPRYDQSSGMARSSWRCFRRARQRLRLA
jgi:hypothetical protein